MIRSRFTVTALFGAAAMYVLDPTMGKRRRAVTRDKVRSRLNRGRRRMRQHAVYEENRKRGEVMQRAGAGRFHQRDDRSVAEHLHQVLKRLEVPTNDVTIEVVDDRVRLRGQVESVADMTTICGEVAGEAGNREVESYLHLPGEPAPNKMSARLVGSAGASRRP